MEVIIYERMNHNGNNGHNNSQEIFHKVEDVVYCTSCGSRSNSSNIHRVCLICGNEEFISGDLAETLAGYIELSSKGLLRKYYRLKFKKSSVRMNYKRMILWLLRKEGVLVINDKEKEDIVRRILWKRF